MLAPGTTFRWALLLSALLLWTIGTRAWAQTPEPRTSLALRGVPLEDAIERFVDATDIAVSYDPRLVRGRRAFCAVEDAPPEAVLQCILRDSGLDYVRLSSGTYVLTAPAEAPPARGHLAGTVTDRATSAPLADAHVHLTGTQRGTTTNRAGQFVFPALLPGTYTVRVSHLGYRTWADTVQVSPADRTHAAAALRSEPIFITPVVVDGAQQRAEARWASQRSVRAEAPPVGQAAGAQAPYRGLGALSGVRLNDVTADVHLQGSRPGAHQLRLDGVPVYLPRTTLGLIGPFSAFAIDRVTVEKAGFAAAYGSQTAGIVSAEHALAAQNRADVQIDPLSADARVQGTRPLGGSKRVAAMGAARVGLWDVYEPSRLRDVLASWSAPDPFLLQSANEAIGRTLPITPTTPTDPTAHFADVHAAARVNLSPLRTLRASGYHGRRRLTGGIFRGLGITPDQATTEALLTTQDDYQWTNTLGQISYDAVLGDRTLFSAQLRGSRYALDHTYDILDSLRVLETAEGMEAIGRSTLSVDDGNTVRTVALDGSVDYAWRAHDVQGGVAVAHTQSTFALYGARLIGLNRDLAFSEAFDALSSGPPQRVQHRADRWAISAFASDTWTLSDPWATTLGVRLTYLPRRATVYAEPRLAFRYQRPESAVGAWSARTAAGLYRQFTQQTDVSVLNAGALLPAARVWLPLDSSVRPPRTYHLTQAVTLQPAPAWRLSVEGYAKFQPHRLAMRYVPATETTLAQRVEQQRQFLTAAQGRTLGGSVAAEWRGDAFRLRARYEYSHATQRAEALFGGRRVPSPWSEPQRVEAGLDWRPTERFTASLRGQGIWGRPWGFHRAYYDYFGQQSEAPVFGGIDLSRPGDHVLPPLLRLDASLAYTRTFGSTTLQARVDVLNVTGRHNVADWRLQPTGADGWERAPRYRYPRMPAVALRLQL